MTQAQLTLDDLRIQAAHQEGLAIQGWLSARAQSHVSELATAQAARITAERERDAARQEVEALKAELAELKTQMVAPAADGASDDA